LGGEQKRKEQSDGTRSLIKKKELKGYGSRKKFSFGGK